MGRGAFAVVLGGIAALGSSAQVASAALVDYARLDIGPTGQRVESGWVGVGSASSGANATNLADTALSSLTGDAFSIAIDNGNPAVLPGVDWRDRGDSASSDSLVRVGEDFIKNNGGVIRVTLSGVEAGTYTVTSYHRDPDNGQSDMIEVIVSDAVGTNIQQSSFGNAGPAGGAGIGGVNALTTANVTSTAAVFSFVSNGVDPVTIVFDGRASADDETPLNGLLIQVPEPASLGLLGLATATLLLRRRPGR